jgi:succinate dehydrogenase/fumarate reductase-like Fe-S protein
MRTHMYAQAYGNTHMANYTIGHIGTGVGIDACSDCQKCTAVCIHNVPVADRISDLKTLYQLQS